MNNTTEKKSKKSNKEESTVESENNEAESEIVNREDEINSFEEEIKGWKMILNFGWRRLQILLALLSTPWWLIRLKIDNSQLVNDAPNENNRQEINFSEDVDHEINSYEDIRKMYPYKLFKKELLPNLSKKS